MRVWFCSRNSGAFPGKVDAGFRSEMRDEEIERFRGSKKSGKALRDEGS
jgi:hypothetical protein